MRASPGANLTALAFLPNSVPKRAREIYKNLRAGLLYDTVSGVEWCFNRPYPRTSVELELFNRTEFGYRPTK